MNAECVAVAKADTWQCNIFGIGCHPEVCDDQSLHYTVLYVSEEQEYCYGDGVNEFANPNEVGC